MLSFIKTIVIKMTLKFKNNSMKMIIISKIKKSIKKKKCFKIITNKKSFKTLNKIKIKIFNSV